MDNSKPSQYVHLTYPYDRPGPKRGDPKLDFQTAHRLFNYATPSLKGLSEIPWKDITACTISSGGSSNGAILLQTLEGNLAVKGPSNPASEYFAYLLYKELRIPVPSLRVLQYTDEEFKTAINCIQKATYADNTLKYKVRQVLDRPFLFVMEYIPFQKIYQLGEQRAKHCFNPGYPEGRDRLIRMGIMYAADTLLNIRDRYPLIWGNPGNPENLIIGFNTSWVTQNEELFDKGNVDLQMTVLSPIDNRPLLIGKGTGLSQEAYELYLEEFEKIVKFSFEGLKPVKEGKINPFDSTTKRFDYTSLASTFIYNHTSHDIKPLGELQILLGLVIGYVNIYNMGIQRIERMRKKAMGILKTDWKDIWKDDWESLKLDIIKDEIRIIEKHIKGNEEIIGWVATITLNNYYITFEKLPEDDMDDSLALNQDDQSFSGGPSSKNVDEYDEWLEKKMNQYFGITSSDMPPPSGVNLQANQSYAQPNSQTMKANLQPTNNSPSTQPGMQQTGTKPGTQPAKQKGTKPGTQAAKQSGTQPSMQTGTQPGAQPNAQLGMQTGTNQLNNQPTNQPTGQEYMHPQNNDDVPPPQNGDTQPFMGMAQVATDNNAKTKKKKKWW